jgi:hypothetical protein
VSGGELFKRRSSFALNLYIQCMIKKLLIAFCVIPFGTMAQPSQPDDSTLLALQADTHVLIAEEKPHTIETRLELGRMDAEYVLFVNSSEATSMLVQLMDQTGRAMPLVRQVLLEIGENEIRIDLTIYPAGSYMISLQAPHQRSSVIHRLYKQ